MRWHSIAAVIGLAISVSAGTCDRYYPLRRTVKITTAPNPNCVTDALQAADIGEVTHSCDSDADTGVMTDYYRIQGSRPQEWVTFAIPRSVSDSSKARLSWGLLNRQPSAEETARIRTMMTEAYSAAQKACVGLPDPSDVTESCGWCR